MRNSFSISPTISPSLPAWPVINRMLSVSRISAAGCSQQTDSIAVMQVYHSDFRQILDLTYLVLYDLFNASFILQSEGKNLS